ncbi:polysaccharide deacetylase family protein [Maribacter polysaccharolyticus]|uniref:polysaccharide deacetylase family protein n=1 Tax=Maribacter polysaccharolyticus TaxID=3020831 RepID=UPI00237FD454|nr:polysaccharide deacetylase family protein [Maribacter polysaccharolyticus]MDE3742516.1 polysaccharide deacetylase family protein [Maribacter polysaccharolyticus]
MTRKYLSFGYDTERPYGEFAQTKIGSELRKKLMGFIRKLNGMFDQEDVPRTFFILGHYLEACLTDYDIDALREVYHKDNPLIELQQHSYSHPIIRKIKGREEKKVITSGEFIKDLQQAGEVIENILGVYPNGVRTPIGYHHDLSDMPEILEGMQGMGIRYVSSNLRSEDSLEAPLNRNRQPHDYGNIGYPTIVEMPSHGWQDVIFTKEKAAIFLGREPDSQEKICKHFDELLLQANDIDLPVVNIALCLHPWAVMEYDPQFEIHKHIINSARSMGFELKSYGQVADMFRHEMK